MKLAPICALLSVFYASVLQAASITAAPAEVLRLWGTQKGQWQGQIEIYSAGKAEPLVVGLTSTWDQTPDAKIITKIETFSRPGAADHSVTLMMADGDNSIVTPYYAGGKQHDYKFDVVSATVTDDSHWTTVIASPSGREVYEGRSAVLRYTRIRNGDVIDNLKEVKFLDGEHAFEKRSVIRQTLGMSKK